MKGLQTLFQVGILKQAENSAIIEGVLNEIIVDALDIVENKEVSEYNSEVIAKSVCEFETQVRIYDIGALHEHVSKKEIEEWVNAESHPKPSYIPPDVTGEAFPFSLS
ncbi:hypothetical protein LOD99_810 [Oopsacas minuta]|uniref:Uncharacterized protein n=1 Tax=Oopsacas minuta TaxID=111878 RepID=A0AAV7K0Y6_9METZ|nr:hypothetical protein LOD99_810 [Oopsacas minuta]